MVQARYHERNNRLELHKFCPEHGPSSAVVSTDAAWTQKYLNEVKPADQPLKVGAKVEHGCPHDCGLCTDHEQHSCFIQIEITDTCDLTCPNCYMGPHNKWYLTLEEADRMFKRIGELEGVQEVLTLTGGEPTLHPKLFELAELALAHDIRYVLVNTNGNRIAREPDFAKRMADLGLVCYLQFDGFDDDVYRKLRGKPLLETKLKALENLEKAGCDTVLSPVIARGLNEHQLGKIVQLGVSKKFIKAVNFLPMTYVKQVGDGTRKSDSAWKEGESSCADPQDRLTLTDMHQLLEQHTDGFIKSKDFTAVPCHHPSCGSVTYVITGVDGRPIPVSRIFEAGPLSGYIKNRSRVDMEDLLQVTRIELEKLRSSEGLPAREKYLAGVRDLVTKCCGTDCAVGSLFEDAVTQISVHAFMDAHTWEVDRARKCCIHFMLPDGKLMPFCQYNIFHRDGHSKRAIMGERAPCAAGRGGC